MNRLLPAIVVHDLASPADKVAAYKPNVGVGLAQAVFTLPRRDRRFYGVAQSDRAWFSGRSDRTQRG